MTQMPYSLVEPTKMFMYNFIIQTPSTDTG